MSGPCNKRDGTCPHYMQDSDVAYCGCPGGDKDRWRAEERQAHAVREASKPWSPKMPPDIETERTEATKALAELRTKRREIQNQLDEADTAIDRWQKRLQRLEAAKC